MIHRIFLAGPYTYWDQARKAEYLRDVSAAETESDIHRIGPVPPTCEPAGIDEPTERGLWIGKTTIERLRDTQGLVADLSPFRGPHPEPSTVLLLGMAAGLGMPIAAYTTADPAKLENRVLYFPDNVSGCHAALIEDFDLHCHAVLEAALTLAGSRILVADDHEEGLRLAFGELRRLIDDRTTGGGEVD